MQEVKDNEPFGDEIAELRREVAVRGQARRIVLDYLFELIKRRAPRLVGKLPSRQFEH